MMRRAEPNCLDVGASAELRSSLQADRRELHLHSTTRPSHLTFALHFTPPTFKCRVRHSSCSGKFSPIDVI